MFPSTDQDDPAGPINMSGDGFRIRSLFALSVAGLRAIACGRVLSRRKRGARRRGGREARKERGCSISRVFLERAPPGGSVLRFRFWNLLFLWVFNDLGFASCCFVDEYCSGFVPSRVWIWIDEIGFGYRDTGFFGSRYLIMV